MSHRKGALGAARAELDWMVTHFVHVASFFFFFFFLIIWGKGNLLVAFKTDLEIRKGNVLLGDIFCMETFLLRFVNVLCFNSYRSHFMVST